MYAVVRFAPGEEGKLPLRLQPLFRLIRDCVEGKHVAVTGGSITAAEWICGGREGQYLVLGLSDGCIELHTRKGRRDCSI